MKNVGSRRRFINQFIKLNMVFDVLLLLIIAFVVTHLRSIVLAYVRSNYPDSIIHIEEVEYGFPMDVIARGVYLQHKDDTDAASTIRIPEVSLNVRYGFPKKLEFEDVTLVGAVMRIDNSSPENVPAYQAFTVTEPGREDEPATEGEGPVLPFNVTIRNGYLEIVGANYDVTMNVNMDLQPSVKEDRGYDVSGSLKDFLVVSYDFKTKPLYIECEAYLPHLNFADVVPIEETRFLVNDIPVIAEGNIVGVSSGYRVEADVHLYDQRVHDVLELMEYQVPVVSDFDIDASVNIDAKVVYDPDMEEFIRVYGRGSVGVGTANSEYYEVELSDLSAFLPFEYRGTISTYAWGIGKRSSYDVPTEMLRRTVFRLLSLPYDVGRISAKAIDYDRYNVTELKTLFSTDGTWTRFADLTLEGYSGMFRGDVEVVVGLEDVWTDLLVYVDKLDMSELLDVFEQKTFNVRGTASGILGLKLTNDYIENIAVNLKTEDGIFAIEDIGESLSSLPGGDVVTEQLKSEMGKPEYWDAFIAAMKYYPYDQGRVDVTWDPQGVGLLQLDLWLQGKEPEAGTEIFFPTVPITIGYHGINSVTDLFNIDEVLQGLGKN